MANFDGDRCRRRARIAAVRDGVDATHVHFFRGDSAYWEAGSRPAHGVARTGVMPTTPESAIRLINASLAPVSGKELGLDDVYIHYVEAANSRFIGDRFMFLDASTLKNIANAAGSGFAFMNSHRTGGLSSPSELPFGRTFAGRYEEFADQAGATFGRAVVGLYMLKGVHPNGTAGPSTDDLHRSIEAGTLSDVSMGLVGGSAGLRRLRGGPGRARPRDGRIPLPSRPRHASRVGPGACGGPDRAGREGRQGVVHAGGCDAPGGLGRLQGGGARGRVPQGARPVDGRRAQRERGGRGPRVVRRAAGAWRPHIRPEGIRQGWGCRGEGRGTRERIESNPPPIPLSSFRPHLSPLPSPHFSEEAWIS